MEVLCYKCGAENWLENEVRCHACNVVLRRCGDCVSYDTVGQTCRTLHVDIDLDEAERPMLLSTSANCRDFALAPDSALKMK